MERIRYDLDPNSSDTDICDDVLYCPDCDEEIAFQGGYCQCESHE